MSNKNHKYVPIAPKKKNTIDISLKGRNRMACDLCKVKKAKCNVMDGFKNCRNCLLVDEGCTFNLNRKKKAPLKRHVSLLEEKLERIEELLKNATSGDKRRLFPVGKMVDDTYQDPKANQQTADTLEDDIQKNTYILREDKRKLKDMLNRLILPFGIQAQLDSRIHQILIKESELTNFDSFIDPVQDYIGGEPIQSRESINSINDWIYKVAGIEKDLSDKLLKIYFAYIHPSTPVVNKTLFLEEYRRIRPEFPFPTLLLSMYLAAIKYATNCIEAGDDEVSYGDKSGISAKELSENFVDRMWKYQKLRYLPTIASLQAIVIGQIHCLNSEKRAKDWVLCFNGIQMCYDLGLHRSSEKLELSQKEKETRRRLLWSLYVLDHWLSAESGRPLSILDEEITEVYPSENADWDEVMDSMTNTDHHLPRFPSLNENTAKTFKKKPIPLYQPLVQMIKLSKILGVLLQNMYTPQAKKRSIEHGSDSIVAYIDNALSSWRSGFPHLLEITQPDKVYTNNDLSHSLLSMRGLISLSYYTILILLHRPFIRKNAEEKSALSEKTSLAICTSAATKILEISDLMRYHDFLLISWGYAAYPSVTATSIHLFNFQNANTINIQSAKSKVFQGIKIVNKINAHSTIKGKLNNFIAECLPHFGLSNYELELNGKIEGPTAPEEEALHSGKIAIENFSISNTTQKHISSKNLYSLPPNDYSWLDEFYSHFPESKYPMEQGFLDAAKEASAFSGVEDLYSITQFGFSMPEFESSQHIYDNNTMYFQSSDVTESSLLLDTNNQDYCAYHNLSEHKDDNSQSVMSELDSKLFHYTFPAAPLTFQNYENAAGNFFWGVPDSTWVEYADLNITQKTHYEQRLDGAFYSL
ncbi:fungal-specific transcription factor domain-containing protein, partial [Sporodiniella umbellata]